MDRSTAVAAPMCGDEVWDTDGTVLNCILPQGHRGWHLDDYALVDSDERRLPCEIRWAPKTVNRETV